MDEKELAQVGLEFMWERLKESIGAISKSLKAAKRRKEDQKVVEKIENELSEVLRNLLTLNPDLMWADQVIQLSESRPMKPTKLQIVKDTRARVAVKTSGAKALTAAKKPASKKTVAKKPAVKKAAPKKPTVKKAAK